jgi:hypothetical protein
MTPATRGFLHALSSAAYYQTVEVATAPAPKV